MHKSLTFCAVLVFSTAFLGFLHSSTAQNCAIPQHVSLPLDDDVHTECAAAGTVLTSLTTKNIVSLQNVTVTPPNFIRVELEENGTLSLIVDQPLYNLTHADDNHQNGTLFFPKKTYIDETWSESIEARVELECSDGINKIITFTIPISDKNTQPPLFTQTNYPLTMGPCYNGTHGFEGSTLEGMACPLNFETSILVSDADRDFTNADMTFTTNRPDMIRISSSIVEINAPRSSSNLLSPNNHMRNVRLYLQESDAYSVGNIFKFNLTAYNNGSLSPDGLWPYGYTTITIRFGPISDGENSTVLKAPVFSSNAYYAKIDSLFQTLPGTPLFSIEPSAVSAKMSEKIRYAIGGLGYGPDPEPDPGEDEDEKFKVRYSIESDILTIDNATGQLYFNENASTTLPTDRSFERLFEITAFFETYEFLPARVPLLIFFSLSNTVTTTDPPMCPDCPSTGTTCGEMTTPYANMTENPITVNPTAPTITMPHSTSTTTRPNETITDTTPIFTTTGPNSTAITEVTPNPSTALPTTETTPTFTTVTTPISSTEGSSNSTITQTTPIFTTNLPITSTQQTFPTSTEASSMITTEATMPTSSTSTTTQQTSTYPAPPTSQAPTSTTNIPISTSTTSTWLTTFLTTSMNPITSTSDYNSTTESSPIEGDCCEQCAIVKDFKCPVNNNDDSLLFPDPHDCETFYQCTSDDYSFIPNIVTFNCEEGQIFCPELQSCVIPTDCVCTGFNAFTDCPSNFTEGCEIPCGFYPNDHPDNVCNAYGEITTEYIPDPKYNDIFHSCVNQNQNISQGYLDWVKPCTTGLIYCHELNICDWPATASDTCKDANIGKKPYRCNPCHNFYLEKGVRLPYA